MPSIATWAHFLRGIILLLALSPLVLAQSKGGARGGTKKTLGRDLCIAHYNVENLFDTLDDPTVNDQDFLPSSPLAWGEARYYHKIGQISNLIAHMNRGSTPDFLGICEIENQRVLQDLLGQPALRKSNLAFVHSESKDPRGIDVALLYNKTLFKPFARWDLPIDLPGDSSSPTRPILVVSGRLLSGDTLHFLVNHWPSRRGGNEKSAPNRYAAARRLRQAVDSLFTRYGGPERSFLVITGDFNDTPLDPSIRLLLGADSSSSRGLFHPWAGLEGGSYCYQDRWEWLDQIILSQGFVPQSKDAKTLHYIQGSASVPADSTLRQQEGKFKGYPFRTYAGNRYLGGPSDHLPVHLYLRCPSCP
jgi:predicted extracellular nuclease